MGEVRGEKAASSLMFKLLESFGMQGIAFVVGLVLARLLDPTDYGVLGMLTVFIAFSQVFVQSGLNTALIQKKDADETDFSSAFWLSLGVALALYLLLFAFAPLICRLMKRPEITPVLRVLALILIPGALVSIQGAAVARRMQFRRMMLCSLCATVVSGAVGIGMASAGMRYWALVGQQLSNQLCLAVLLLIFISWRPKRLFSWQRVSGLLRYGWKLLVSGVLETGYVNLRSLVIGLKYDTAALGYFTRGKQFPELVMNAVNGSIQSVMLPVLSREQDDKTRMKELMRRSVKTSSFVVLPLMAGLAGVAAPMVTLLIGEKWLPCVPFLQICCIDFAFYPIHTANLQAINAMGRSDVFLKLELIKKSYGLAILFIALLCFDTPIAIAWGAAISTLLSALVNASPNRKLLGYGYLEQMRDVLPSVLMALAMFGVVLLMGSLPLAPIVLLPLQVLTGVVIYLGLALVTRSDSLQFLLETLRGLLSRSRAKEEETV
ncbi:MAG: lipopolysaccharide biosynthesis protein [Clostridiales bacterium]|nr:lipopolysaccharide biosynthesis protein [Clostridiales bacterium]